MKIQIIALAVVVLVVFHVFEKASMSVLLRAKQHVSSVIHLEFVSRSKLSLLKIGPHIYFIRTRSKYRKSAISMLYDFYSCRKNSFGTFHFVQTL